MNTFRLMFHRIAAVAHYIVAGLALVAIAWVESSPATWTPARWPIAALVLVLVMMIPLRLFVGEPEAKKHLQLVVENTTT